MGAPIGIGLVAGIAFPAMIIGWLYYINRLYCDSINMYIYSVNMNNIEKNVLLQTLYILCLRYTGVGRSKIVYEI